MSDDPPRPGGPDDRLLSWRRVREITGLSRTTAWRMQNAGDFPVPVRISPGRVGWWESELDAWKASRAPGYDRPMPRGRPRAASTTGAAAGAAAPAPRPRPAPRPPSSSPTGPAPTSERPAGPPDRRPARRIPQRPRGAGPDTQLTFGF